MSCGRSAMTGALVRAADALAAEHQRPRLRGPAVDGQRAVLQPLLQAGAGSDPAAAASAWSRRWPAHPAGSGSRCVQIPGMERLGQGRRRPGCRHVFVGAQDILGRPVTLVQISRMSARFCVFASRTVPAACCLRPAVRGCRESRRDPRLVGGETVQRGQGRAEQRRLHQGHRLLRQAAGTHPFGATRSRRSSNRSTHTTGTANPIQRWPRPIASSRPIRATPTSIASHYLKGLTNYNPRQRSARPPDAAGPDAHRCPRRRCSPSPTSTTSSSPNSDSRYAPDARARMLFLRNNLASYELQRRAPLPEPRRTRRRRQPRQVRGRELREQPGGNRRRW